MAAVEYVDVSDIHLRDIQFRVTRADGRVLDFSEAVTEFNWSDHVASAGAQATIMVSGEVKDVLSIGGEGSSCTITAPLVDLDTGRLVRRELWRGIFEETVDDRSEGQISRTITAYDIAKLFATNDEDYVFTNTSLSAILQSLCRDFGVPTGTIPDTGKSLGQVIGRGIPLWDLLTEAVQRHADLTGEIYRIYASEGRISMKRQGDQSRFWVFESGESLQQARRTRSLADMINQVRIYGVFEGETDKPPVESTKSNEESKALYGLRQRIAYLSAADDNSSVIDIAQKMLDRFSVPDESIDITGWLVPNLRAGEQIRFIDAEWGINRIYYVESIDTTWSMDRAETYASVRREAIDPGLILEEVTVA